MDQFTDEFHEFNKVVDPAKVPQSLELANNLQLKINEYEKRTQEQQNQLNQLHEWGIFITENSIESPGLPLIDNIRGNDYIQRQVIGMILARLGNYCLKIKLHVKEAILKRTKLLSLEDQMIEKEIEKIASEVYKEATYVFKNYIEVLENIKDSFAKEICNLFVPLVLKDSRTLVDNFRSAFQSGTYISNLGYLKYKNLKPDEQIAIDQAKNFLRKVIFSPLVSSSLATVLESSVKYAQSSFNHGNTDMLSQGKTSQQTLETLQYNMFELLDHIEFVKCIPNGLVTMRGIAMSKKNLFALKSDNYMEYVKARFVVLFIHEAFHYLFRRLSNDFGWVTPRHNGFDLLEGGYFFERLIFGCYDREIWRGCEKEILSEERWNNSSSVLSKIEFNQKCIDRGINNPKHSGLCVDGPKTKEF